MTYENIQRAMDEAREFVRRAEAAMMLQPRNRIDMDACRNHLRARLEACLRLLDGAPESDTRALLWMIGDEMICLLRRVWEVVR